ncbi:hypothetical protein HanPSC8_Chr10g0434341 [Helianthus annuus]|nr:hypothetical protein HanPSC8_Chr10g0434341 [Helianthus annuus]
MCPQVGGEQVADFQRDLSRVRWEVNKLQTSLEFHASFSSLKHLLKFHASSSSCIASSEFQHLHKFKHLMTSFSNIFPSRKRSRKLRSILPILDFNEKQ